MEFLWSPWRYTYVSTARSSTPCPFCIGESVQLDRERLVLHRGQFNFVIMNLYPYTAGHLLVVPYAHIDQLGKASEDQICEMMMLSRRAVDILEEAYQPEGFNVGMNLGECAGAGVRDHLHLHVVPRWCGDANFMTSTAETRMLPEGLLDSYGKLKSLFDGNVISDE